MLLMNSPLPYLSLNDDFVKVFVADGTVFLVPVVECDGHGGLSDSGLTVFVHQLLKICSTHLRKETQIPSEIILNTGQ